MKTPKLKMTRALTMIEVLMIVAVLMLLAAMFLPSLVHRYPDAHRAPRIACVNNLKQVGIAFRIWAGDNNDKYPMQVASTNGGTMEFVDGPNAWLHFLVLSNELNTPKILFCPSETDSSRKRATYFPGVSYLGAAGEPPFTGNFNLSYFVGVDAVDTEPLRFLSGDHNLTNGTAIVRGMLTLTTNHPSGWTDEMHRNQGNVGLADGSVEMFSTAGLRTAIESTGIDTNRLTMP